MQVIGQMIGHEVSFVVLVVGEIFFIDQSQRLDHIKTGNDCWLEVGAIEPFSLSFFEVGADDLIDMVAMQVIDLHPGLAIVFAQVEQEEGGHPAKGVANHAGYGEHFVDGVYGLRTLVFDHGHFGTDMIVDDLVDQFGLGGDDLIEGFFGNAQFVGHIVHRDTFDAEAKKEAFSGFQNLSKGAHSVLEGQSNAGNAQWLKRFLRFFDRNNIWFDEGKNEATSGFVSRIEQDAEYGLEDLIPGSMFLVPGSWFLVP